MSNEYWAWAYQFRTLFGFDPISNGILTYEAATEYCYRRKPEMYPQRAAMEAAQARIKTTEAVKAVEVALVNPPQRFLVVKRKTIKRNKSQWQEMCGMGYSPAAPLHFSSDEFDIEPFVIMACNEVDDYCAYS